jgi:hypothetical protein
VPERDQEPGVDRHEQHEIQPAGAAHSRRASCTLFRNSAVKSC